MTANSTLLAAVKVKTPAEWELVAVTDLDQLGDWNDLLLYRFMLLDLDEVDAFDPIDVIRQVRLEYQINTPVFCFGGDEAIQEEMRLGRADRFFTVDEILEKLPKFFESYAW